LDSAADSTLVAPLYTYADDSTQISNLKREIVSSIEKIVGKIAPEDVFDYTYAVLHSPSYREKYKEFLKIDFPRVPYPKDKKQFTALVKLGKELRELHLFESSKIKPNSISYPEDGSDVVEKISFKDEKVYINAMQYFGDVPETSWEFYIGGYQPAQKWLKDRKGRKLSNAEIEHYQKIIVTLTETSRLMDEIDKVISFT
jgi:predicted helicase